MIIAPDFSPGAYVATEEIENDPNSPITDVILRIESM